MVIAALIVVGLCLGSFVNALVWRIHEQSGAGRTKKTQTEFHKRLSIVRGRSMCPECKHELAAKDLLPVLSWLALRGRCRYCSKSISPQYPLVELTMGALFVASYLWWPASLSGVQILAFLAWLLLLTGLMALLVYDLRWMLLPDRIMQPLTAVAAFLALIQLVSSDHPLRSLIGIALAVIVGGGLFYALYQVSGGKWIGGGDVKLGALLGLVVGTPARSLLMIFMAAALGSLISVPLLASRRLKPNSIVPFGPFLIIAAILVQFFGQEILHWYRDTFLLTTV